MCDFHATLICVVWKLKDRKVQEAFRELLKLKIPKTEVGSVEEEWDKFKEAFVSSPENSCGRMSGKDEGKGDTVE